MSQFGSYGKHYSNTHLKESIKNGSRRKKRSAKNVKDFDLTREEMEEFRQFVQFKKFQEFEKT